jgi:hypothetical protein
MCQRNCFNQISPRRYKCTGISRRGCCDLRLLDDIGVHAQNLVIGFGINIAAAVVVARGEDLGVTKVGQVGRSKSLWCTVTMSVEHVNTQHCLSRHSRREKGQSNERIGQHFWYTVGTRGVGQQKEGGGSNLFIDPQD